MVIFNFLSSPSSVVCTHSTMQCKASQGVSVTPVLFLPVLCMYSSLSMTETGIVESDGQTNWLSVQEPGLDTRYEFIRKLIIALFNVCKTSIISHINIYFVLLIKPKIHRLSSLSSWPNVSYLFLLFALSSHHIFTKLPQSGLSSSPGRTWQS